MKPKLLEQVRNKIRIRHYSIRTEKTYLDWIKRYILFHHKKHPKDMGAAEVEAFLTYLAVKLTVAASTQNQALNALLFLYREVLEMELPLLRNVKRAKRSEKLPVVFSKMEIKSIMAHLDGVYWIMGQLLYGGGLRLMECVRLRIKDVDFGYRQITIRDGSRLR
jgi:integrase